MGFLTDLIFGYDPGTYQENLDGSGEWVGGRDSAEANRREQAERNNRLSQYEKNPRAIMQEPKINYFQFFLQKETPQELFNLISEKYSFYHFFKDFKKMEGIEWSNEEIAKRICDEMLAYDQVDKILKVDPSQKNKIKQIMPTYDEDRKIFLDNIKKVKSYMYEIIELLPDWKKKSFRPLIHQEKNIINHNNEER